MASRLTDAQIRARLRSAFRRLRIVEDKLETLTNQAPEPKGNPLSQQAHTELKAVLVDLNFISDSFEEDLD